MKTPEEIKKWLKCWAITYTDECTGNCESCEYDVPMTSSVKMGAVALEYITQLEQRLAQAERERDAAVSELKKFGCPTCAKYDRLRPSILHDDCVECVRFSLKHWQWRGVCEENSKEEQQ